MKRTQSSKTRYDFSVLGLGDRQSLFLDWVTDSHCVYHRFPLCSVCTDTGERNYETSKATLKLTKQTNQIKKAN